MNNNMALDLRSKGRMNVAVMFSGGKDSCYAIRHCIDNGWDVTLIAVKPVSDEAYLWHYATVEHTKLQAEAMQLPLIYVNCNEIGPQKEAQCLETTLANLSVDALVLGGVGLQRTQIREIGAVARRHGIDVLVPHQNYTSEQLLKKELQEMEIVITEVAAAGLGKEWLGKKINGNLEELKALSERFGFDLLGEGGSYNTFVTDAPYFKKKIQFSNAQIRWDEKTRSGHIVADAMLVNKENFVLVSQTGA